MKISLTNFVIDTDEISYIHKDSEEITLNFKSPTGMLYALKSTPDYYILDSLFFLGGLPDVVVPADTILARKELTSQLAETRRELTEQAWQLQLLEEREQIARNKEMIEDIEKLGLEAYRNNLRQGRDRMPDLGSLFDKNNLIKQ